MYEKQSPLGGRYALRGGRCCLRRLLGGAKRLFGKIWELIKGKIGKIPIKMHKESRLY